MSVAASPSTGLKKRTGFALVAVVLLATAASVLLSGCCNVGYLWQSMNGHLDLLKRARPVEQVVADPATPPDLRARLELSQRMRAFAVTELKLPDNASYRRFADLGRNAVVWNVIAAPELSLTLKTWCFPVTGCIGYRGYYDRAEAEAFGAGLRAEQLEVDVYGVPAYSTLGKLPSWAFFSDPLLNTFIRNADSELARLIFHELAHQVAYAKDDTLFNESFATAVERIGSARWLEREGTPAARAQAAAIEERRGDFRALTRRYRERLEAVYKSAEPEAAKRAAKAEVMAALREDYARLKAERWGGFAGYDAWFARANNATFGVLAAYTDLAGDFERLFERQGGDFERFYAEVRRLADLPKDERHRTLAAP